MFSSLTWEWDTIFKNLNGNGEVRLFMFTNLNHFAGYFVNGLKIRIILSAAVLLCVGTLNLHAQISPDEVQESLLTRSIASVLETNEKVTWEKSPIDTEFKKEVIPQLKIKTQLPDVLHLGHVWSGSEKYTILLDSAPSKSERFTFAIYLREDNSIEDVDVLTYRENYGYEIDYPVFRNQFRGKANPQELIFRRTIRNITGATISARSITYAVRDLLTIYQHITSQ